MRKSERRQLIARLISERELATQSDLVSALKEEGCLVTQATVSRDLREMGVQKGSDRQGRMGYRLPPPRVTRDPEAALARILREAAAEVRQAQNLVVIRSEPGTAPSVGRAVDELEDGGIIGTVAGDDTVLLVLADAEGASRMAGYLDTSIRQA